MPGMAVSWAVNSAAGIPRSRRSEPSAIARAAPRMLTTRVAGPRKNPAPCSAISTAVGNSPGVAESSPESRPSTVRAEATEICCPIMVRNSVSAMSRLPGRRSPGRALTRGVKTGSAESDSSIAAESASRSSSRRTRETRVDRSAIVSSRAVHSTASAPSRRISMWPMPPGSRRERANERASAVSTPAMACASKNAMSPAPSNGDRAGSRSEICVALSSASCAIVAVGGALRRSAVGVRSYTACTVSLNCRMLAKPAAKATSAIGRFVLTNRVRAVCAR